MAQINGHSFDINSIAILAALHTSSPKTTMKEKSVSEQVNHENHVAYRMGRYYKSLYAPEDLAAIQSVVSATKAYHISNTLAFLDKGQRLLPTASHMAYVSRIREFKTEYADAVDAFVQGPYARKHKTLPTLLGKLYNPADYPDPSVIADHFALEVRFAPVPKGEHLLITGVANATVQQMQGQVDIDVQTGIQNAMKDCWERVAERVGNMVEALKKYEPAHTDQHGAKIRARSSFHTTLVTNIRDLVELLPVLNVAKDPNLTAIADQMRSELCIFDSEDLKADDGIRAIVAERAQAILDNVSQFLA